MNKDRRKRVSEALAKLDEISLEDLMQELESLAMEEREAYDNMPESIQQGEKGQESSEIADALENAKDSVEMANDALTETREYLESIET